MSLLQMSIFGAIMILAVIVIRALAINRLPKKTFIALWGIVLLRLLVPFSFPSPFSAYSLVNQHIPTPRGAVVFGNATILPAPLIGLPTAGDVVIQGQTAASISPYGIIWGIGMVVCTLFFALSYFKCRRAFRESLPVKNDFLTKWIAAHKLTRRIEIRQSSRICAPLTYGILKPIILMPKNTKWEDTKQIEYILAHEYIHVRRFDCAAKLFLTAALCIHWFNPLVWTMYILYNRDIELSCDETVVRFFGDATKSAYALTLISMEETKNALTPLCNNFSKNAIEERITAIMKMKKTSNVAILIAFSLIIGVATAFATSAATSDKELTSLREASVQEQAEWDHTRNENFSRIEDIEPRPYPHASKADYQSLLKLKTANYQNQSVSAFNATVLEWANEDFERNERVNTDRAWNDFKAQLTEEERSFVTLTTMASGEENAELVKSEFTGNEKQDPILGNFYLTKESNDSNQTAWAELFYQLTYHITDESKLTVGERDRTLARVIGEIQKYWENMDIDTILAMNEDKILKEIATKHSNELIEISFSKNSVALEGMSGPTMQPRFSKSPNDISMLHLLRSMKIWASSLF